MFAFIWCASDCLVLLFLVCYMLFVDGCVSLCLFVLLCVDLPMGCWVVRIRVCVCLCLFVVGSVCLLDVRCSFVFCVFYSVALFVFVRSRLLWCDAFYVVSCCLLLCVCVLFVCWCCLLLLFDGCLKLCVVVCVCLFVMGGDGACLYFDAVLLVLLCVVVGWLCVGCVVLFV